MKKFFLILSISLFFLTFPCLSNVPGPSSTDSFSTSAAPVNGQRMLAGSMLILMSLGVGYSAKKIYVIRSLGKEEI